MNKEALIILTGITADCAKKAHVLHFFRTHGGYDTFLPALWQGGGIYWAGRQLAGFMRRQGIERYARCHFVCYISGGFILRQALSFRPLANLGRIVYVRSPLQERVPGLAIEKFGALAALLRNGKMLFDLAAQDKDKLPAINAEDGVILETGVSQLAAQLGIGSGDYQAARDSPAFCLPPAREIVTTGLSHDQIYSDDALLGAMAGFLRSGSFSDAVAAGVVASVQEQCR